MGVVEEGRSGGRESLVGGVVDVVTSGVVTPGVGVDVAASSVVVDVVVCSLAEGG